MSHANARFTPAGRLLIVQRIEAGMVAKWWHRWLEEGAAGLVDQSSRPRRCPVYLGAHTGLPTSTVWRILKRNGLNRLSWIDRPTGRVIRRYELCAPGEMVHLDIKMVHLDIKKVGKIPPGGGWRVHSRGSQQAKRARRSKRRSVSYTYLHVAIDDYSRVAYVEAHDNETAATLVGFWQRVQDWFWSNDMAVDDVMTDNGPNFASDAFAELLAQRRIRHLRTRPYRPQTNGKAERFNRTLADEFLYNYKFRSENERPIRLKRWIHDYNCHRHHTAVGGRPASRADNLTRTETSGRRSGVWLLKRTADSRPRGSRSTRDGARSSIALGFQRARPLGLAVSIQRHANGTNPRYCTTRAFSLVASLASKRRAYTPNQQARKSQ